MIRTKTSSARGSSSSNSSMIQRAPFVAVTAAVIFITDPFPSRDVRSMRATERVRQGLLGGCESAIDREGRSGGIAGAVGQQERNHARPRLRRAVATQRDGLGERLAGSGEHFVSQLKGHSAGDG